MVLSPALTKHGGMTTLTPTRSPHPISSQLKYAQWQLFNDVFMNVIRKYGGTNYEWPPGFIHAMQTELREAVGWDGHQANISVKGAPVQRTKTIPVPIKTTKASKPPSDSPVNTPPSAKSSTSDKVVKPRCEANNRDGNQCKRNSCEKSTTGRFCASHYADWDARVQKSEPPPVQMQEEGEPSVSVPEQSGSEPEQAGQDDQDDQGDMEVVTKVVKPTKRTKSSSKPKSTSTRSKPRVYSVRPS